MTRSRDLANLADSTEFTSALNTKLTNVETAATADQTNNEIKTAVEAGSDIALGGNPTTTTQSQGNNSTRLATTAYTDVAIAALADSAPSTLNTLNELAAALGDDAAFSTTVTNSIATKMPKSGGAFTGNVTFGDNNKAIFGNDSDFEIYSGGSGAKLHASVGVLEIEGDSVQIWNEAAQEAMAKFTANGSVELYHNNVKRIETTATGIDVTGALTVATLSGSVGTNPVQQWQYSNDPDWKLRLRQIVSSGLVKHTFDLTNAGTDYNNNLVLDRGNVGIGGTPDDIFHVSATNKSIRLSNAGNDNVGLALYHGNSKQSSFTWGNGGANLEIKNFRNDSQTNRPYGNIDFYTGGSNATSGSPDRRMRIRTDGSVLFGGITDKNVFNDTSGTGASINNDAGEMQIKNASDTCLYLNRTGSDGTIVSLRKNGGSLGVIGNRGDSLFVQSSASNRTGLDFSGAILPRYGGGLNSANNVDIGAASYKFKDLYLSGGVVFGPASASTVSSQTLDSYEEGTWSPRIHGDGAVSGQSYGSVVGKYTKIGSFVFLTCDVALTSLGSTAGSHAIIYNLPFSVVTSHMGGGTVGYYTGINNNTGVLSFYAAGNQAYFMKGGGNYVSRSDLTNSTRAIATIIYQTGQ